MKSIKSIKDFLESWNQTTFQKYSYAFLTPHFSDEWFCALHFYSSRKSEVGLDPFVLLFSPLGVVSWLFPVNRSETKMMSDMNPLHFVSFRSWCVVEQKQDRTDVLALATGALTTGTLTTGTLTSVLLTIETPLQLANDTWWYAWQLVVLTTGAS